MRRRLRVLSSAGALRRRWARPRRRSAPPRSPPCGFRAFVSLAAYEVTTLPVWIAASGSMFCVTGVTCAFKRFGNDEVSDKIAKQDHCTAGHGLHADSHIQVSLVGNAGHIS